MSDWLEDYQKFTSMPWSPTTLNAEEEGKFRNWLQETQLFNSIKSDIAKENKMPLDKLKNDRVMEMILQGSDYNYREAWKAGIKETISPHDKKPHWPSSTPEGKMLKSPTHPTAWKEFFMRQYNIDPDELGLDTIEKATNWTQSSEQTVSPFYQDPFLTIK